MYLLYIHQIHLSRQIYTSDTFIFKPPTRYYILYNQPSRSPHLVIFSTNIIPNFNRQVSPANLPVIAVRVLRLCLHTPQYYHYMTYCHIFAPTPGTNKKTPKPLLFNGLGEIILVEWKGFEPSTPALRTLRPVLIYMGLSLAVLARVLIISERSNPQFPGRC